MGWIDPTRNKEKRGDMINTEMNFPITYNRDNFGDLLFPQRLCSM